MTVVLIMVTVVRLHSTNRSAVGCVRDFAGKYNIDLWCCDLAKASVNHIVAGRLLDKYDIY